MNTRDTNSDDLVKHRYYFFISNVAQSIIILKKQLNIFTCLHMTNQKASQKKQKSFDTDQFLLRKNNALVKGKKHLVEL